MSYIQVYKDNVYDLLTKQVKKLTFHELSCPDATTLQVQKPKDVISLVTMAVQQRQVAATQMNAQSSRSHVIFTLRVKTSANTSAVLMLVDLAGSERVTKTKSQGERLEEAKKINQSLSCLGKCVQSLASRQSFVPYRDCALTKLLAESLSGNSRTVLISTVCPLEDNFDETHSTLQFAQRCSKVKTQIKMNVEEFKFDSTKHLTVLGHFDVQNGVGFVKCACARCGAQLIAMDAEAVQADVSEESLKEEIQDVAEMVQSRGPLMLNAQRNTARMSFTGDDDMRRLVIAMQAQVEKLQQENQRQRLIIDSFTSGARLAMQNEGVRSIVLQENAATVQEQTYDDSEFSKLETAEQDDEHFETVVVQPKSVLEASRLRESQLKISEMPRATNNSSLLSQVIDNDRPEIYLTDARSGEDSNFRLKVGPKPIVLGSITQDPNKNKIRFDQAIPPAYPRQIMLKKDYPQMTYDPKSKKLDNIE